ncbi:hypothetical protein [Kineobactrum salinum]|uniref:Uncharacterized protein n=1 Tax=Kineobactrum salinum TaxID=2708301 RepID=A0A6C0UB82_9GAMM|nr:hypothetical protein [Kineobactrum salinum]QIB67264.1 hypothetical protein G3T16_19520 [Kineobactrum salinum]
MQLALAAAGSTVRLEKLHIAGPELILEAAATDDEDSGPEPLVLPELFLPVALVIEDLRLQQPRWRFGELEHQHESLSLRGSWEGGSCS